MDSPGSLAKRNISWSERRLTRTLCYTDFVSLRNVTITLDEETARLARIEAARRDVSVSRMIGELLREWLRSEQGYDAAMKDFLSRPSKRLRTRRSRFPTRDELHDRARLR